MWKHSWSMSSFKTESYDSTKCVLDNLIPSYYEQPTCTAVVSQECQMFNSIAVHRDNG